jgi:hypothetical protein
MASAATKLLGRSRETVTFRNSNKLVDPFKALHHDLGNAYLCYIAIMFFLIRQLSPI